MGITDSNHPSHTQSTDPINPQGHQPGMSSRPASFHLRARSDVDSWVDVSSQPSSSSLSSAADEVITTGLRVQTASRTNRRRAVRQSAPSNMNIEHRPSSFGGTSSQEEYDESESESDRVMTISGEGANEAAHHSAAETPEIGPPAVSLTSRGNIAQRFDDDDDGNKTTINHPLHDNCFTPQPNAFTHPPSGRLRHTSQPTPDSYFPPSRPPLRPSTRHSLPGRSEHTRTRHLPQDVFSPSFNAAAEHDEALRASLSSLLSVAAAARSRAKTELNRDNTTTIAPSRSNRIDPTSLRLVPESDLPASSPPLLQEPSFKPTIRRMSSDSTSTTSERRPENKRKAMPVRNSSRERRALKKARRSPSNDDLSITPTFFTWVISAGVVVFLSALSFRAGYSLGKEAGRLEASSFATDEQIRSCAREAGRSSLGLKRSLARSAIQA